MQSALRDIHAQRLLILDFGSQYTQLIARRVRECGVYCESYPFDISDEDIGTFAPAGVILSGGPETVTEGTTPRIPESIFSLDVPVLEASLVLVHIIYAADVRSTLARVIATLWIRETQGTQEIRKKHNLKWRCKTRY